MRAQEFVQETVPSQQVLQYVKKIHHDFHLDDTILTHPQWELKRVPLNQLHVPDPESGEDLDDPYNRVQMIDMYHVDDITARDIESKPIVVDTDGFIIDGNHRALAARLSGMKNIPAYVPVHQQDNRAGDIAEDLKITGPSANVKDWIAKVYQRFPDTWQNNHVMVWGSGEDQQFAMFELVPSVSKQDAVEVKWFQAYPLRQGVGSRAMRVLQDLAQADGIALTLYPWDKGQVSQAKLMKFYRSMGFTPTVKGSKNLAWTPDISNVDENFADGRKPGRKGLTKRMGVDCKQSISKLRKIAKNSSGERQRMAHWCANMKSGKNAK